MGVRYNAEKKKVGNYYSTPIFAFRCKCHLCSNWFTIENDPKNTRYVVKEGARKKEEDWDPEENGGFAVHGTYICRCLGAFIDTLETDTDKAGPSDPLAALEKTKQQEHQLATIGKPRIAELETLSEHYNADPFAHSSRARKFLRAEKKVEAAKTKADKAVRDKYALPEDLRLAAVDDAELLKEAKDAFEVGRKERDSELDMTSRRLSAAIGSQGVRSGSTSLPGERTNRAMVKGQSSASSAAGASFSLRSRLLQSTTRQSDPFLKQTRTKPPDAKSLGIKFKK